MIVRNLTDELEGYVSLAVRGPGGQTVVEALVDTGFNAYLSLSAAQIAELDLEWSRYATAELADAETFTASLYKVEALWDGQWRTIDVAEMGSTPLLGMQLLKGYRLLIDVLEGGQLTITTLNQG